MKKLLLIFFLTAIGLIVFLFITGGRRPVIRESLSERAKEYVQEQRQEGSQRWRRIKFNESPVGDLGGQRVSVDTCFELKIPFPIRNTKHKGECSYVFAIHSPRGSVVVYQQEINRQTIDEVPAVQLRRLKEDLYQEEKVVIDGREFLVFRKKTQGYEKTAFTLEDGGLFVLTLSFYTNDNLDEKLLEMLSSVSFTPFSPGTTNLSARPGAILN